jgi:hypothetical protein
MENNQSQKNNLGKLILDNDKLSAWQIDEKEKASFSGAIMEIRESEVMYESRVYGLTNDINIKTLAKQNLKTGEIELAILKQNAAGDKTILGRTTFADENIYARHIVDFENMVPFTSKLVTTKKEYADSFDQIMKTTKTKI